MVMAIETSDTLTSVYRNPVSLAATAETGTDVPTSSMNGNVAEGYLDAHITAVSARQKAAMVLAKGLLVSDEQMMLSLVRRLATEAQQRQKALQMVLKN